MHPLIWISFDDPDSFLLSKVSETFCIYLQTDAHTEINAFSDTHDHSNTGGGWDTLGKLKNCTWKLPLQNQSIFKNGIGKIWWKTSWEKKKSSLHHLWEKLWKYWEFLKNWLAIIDQLNESRSLSETPIFELLRIRK